MNGHNSNWFNSLFYVITEKLAHAKYVKKNATMNRARPRFAILFGVLNFYFDFPNQTWVIGTISISVWLRKYFFNRYRGTRGLFRQCHIPFPLDPRDGRDAEKGT